MRSRAFIVIVAVVLAACTSATQTEALREREWKLAWVEAFPSIPAGVATPTLRFEAGDRMGGRTGCNSAGGTYTVDGDRLTIGNIISTKRACAAQAGNQLEVAYLGALEQTRSFRIVDEKLELLDGSGSVVARFI
jgi:putative lipoprotein